MSKALKLITLKYIYIFFFHSVTKPENMEDMVKLITVEPTDADDEKLRYK